MRDSDKAVDWATKAANQGDVVAQMALYSMYLRGLGVTRDNNKAVYWAKKAAESGNVQAQAHLGLAYLRGVGVRKEWARGFAWMSLALLYGYRPFHHRVSLFFIRKFTNDTELRDANTMIRNWLEERRRKLAS